ncbi:MAG: SIR2 family protein [Nitrospira sp.]|nr:SIR2 family protein [Nitrospira sp.]
MLLLGAGASASSGVPTASQCIWEWKREIYLSGNPSLPPSLPLDITLPSVQEKIQSWLDHQGSFPPAESELEYVHYIEHCYPKSEDRTTYFRKRLSGVVPQSGYLLLAMLQNANVFQWIWTTNFDGLIRQARKPELTRPLKEIGLDSLQRLCGVQEIEHCSYLVALHGDYRYDLLRNTSAETQRLNQELCDALVTRVRQQPVVVVGYGGRDQSIMQAFEDSVKERAAGGAIYWCTVPNEKVSSRVIALFELAKTNGYEAHLVEIDGFDDFMVRLARFIFRSGTEAVEVERTLSTSIPERSAFSFSGYRADEDWIKSNGYPVELPRELYQFETKRLTTWKELRQVIAESPVIAGLIRGKVLALGDAETITKVFANHMSSKLEKVPLGWSDFVWKDSVARSILLEALQRSLAGRLNLERKGKATLWDRNQAQIANYFGQRCRAFKAINLSLNFCGNSQFLNLVPTLHIVNDNGTEASKDAAKDIKRQLLGRQWNQQYDQALDSWCDRLLGEKEAQTFEYPPGAPDAFAFRIATPPALARVMIRAKNLGAPLSRKSGERFDAIVLPESQLIFGTARGPHRPKDIHPLRGLINDGPYDLELTQSGICREVRLGVVCPRGYERALQGYLDKLVAAHEHVESKQEYLVGYPGFQQVFRIPLRVPRQNDREWRAIPETPESHSNRVAAQREITAWITRAIDTLAGSASVDVTIVFIPKAWQPYEVVEDETLRLDLHDYVKAHCAQKAIRSQFLRETTLNKSLQCEVLWWLAQAVYVKSQRTPFVLDTDDPDTIFIGIGYGFTRQEKGGVVLGCSHIYDAAGQGLRYQVSRIQNPVWRNENPYLTKDDAIRVGYQARQLFYQTYQKLPRRVVIHKRTPFLKSERDGLAQSLNGLAELEMLTIEHEDAWRFLAYDKFNKCTNMFPVKRNTVMIYGNHECLLWVHGSIKGLSANRTYYQGKSRIPAPLKIIRFAGHSPIERIATEILGLSKMDWNTCDLYTQMPATLESSAAIARVGQLLSHFGPETYDYRLFI